jgi:hypothetical protein
MEYITNAIDKIAKVKSVLEFLSNEIDDTGLCFILDQCQIDLDQAVVDLEFSQNQPKAGTE